MIAVEADKILALYDKEQRRDIEYPSHRREETPHVVRHVPLVDYEDGFVIYSWLNATEADPVIWEQVSYFDALGIDFEWKHFSHDTPPDLLARLQTVGFAVDEPETIMALEITRAPAVLLKPPRADVRQITSVEQLADLVAVQEQVWQENFDWLVPRLTNDLQTTPSLLQVYVAYVSGQPVSSAWIYFHPGSQFASLWGGSTLPAFRGQGFYTALLAARLQAALAAGASFLTIDAGPMSRPIVEKLGFKALTTAHACKWKARKNQEALATKR